MEVLVNSANEVVIDGKPIGNVADAFLNFRDAAGAIYDGLIAYEQSLRDQIATLKADVKTANDTIERTQAEAAVDVQKAASDAADTVAKGQQDALAAIEKARVDSVQEMNDLIVQANQKIRDAQITAAKTQDDCNAALVSAQRQHNDATEINLKAVRDAVASEQAARATQAAAQALQASHWDLSQKLMAQDTEAAKAALTQIQKLEVIGMRAALDERAKSLGI